MVSDGYWSYLVDHFIGYINISSLYWTPETNVIKTMKIFILLTSIHGSLAHVPVYTA